MIDLDDERSHSEDLDELRSLLRRIIGQRILFFRASYDDELTLHLGTLIPYRSPKMKSLQRGSYLLASRASDWILEPGSPPSRILSSDGFEVINAPGRAKPIELAEIEGQETIRPGSIVTDASPSSSRRGLILSLSFSDDSTLVLLPSAHGEPGGEDEEPLSDWEIFMPGSRLLRAGPGESWSYVDSRVKPSRANPA